MGRRPRPARYEPRNYEDSESLLADHRDALGSIMGLPFVANWTLCDRDAGEGEFWREEYPVVLGFGERRLEIMDHLHFGLSLRWESIDVETSSSTRSGGATPSRSWRRSWASPSSA